MSPCLPWIFVRKRYNGKCVCATLSSVVFSEEEPVLLREVSCTGFKSLDSFLLEFKPGLNVLVGPNGSGKTNIIILLEFLNYLRHTTLTEAVSRMGGAGRIFRRKSAGLLRNQIKVGFSGTGAAPSHRSGDYHSGTYRYDATISLIPDRNTIIYSHQEIDINILLMSGATARFALSIDSSSDENVAVKIKHVDPDILRQSRLRKDKSEFQSQIEDVCQASSAIFVIDLIDRFVLGCDLVSRDIAGARSFNIDPKNVREPEDIAAPAYIQPNGEGFAATLNALQPRPLSVPVQRYAFYANFPREYDNSEFLLKQIIQYAALVNTDIVHLSVKSDPIESRISVFVDLKYEGGYISLPISLVSDGTAKWLALITAIITRPNIFAIEEPENFLHPAMQQEIIGLVRRQSDPYGISKNESFALITTHSETIINSIMPEELVIVSINGGVTRACRPSNAIEVNEELSRTGFGLSYYYMSGAIES